MKQISKRLTYANVMSSIAVFLVLGGATALAAGLAKNSVGSKQIKKNAVTTAKIKNNAVTTGKIANGAINAAKLGAGAVGASAIGAGSITGDKLANGAVTGEKLANGAVTGEKVAAGAIGRGNLAEGALLPRGFAFVGSGGEVSSSINVPDASHPESGVFCFDLAFAPANAQVAVEGDSEPNDIASIVIPAVGEETLVGCPAGTDLEVDTFDTESQEFSSESFFLVVW